MGFLMFQEDTQFKPSDYGIKNGQLIQVIAVGGGGAGGGVSVSGANKRGGHAGESGGEGYTTGYSYVGQAGGGGGGFGAGGGGAFDGRGYCAGGGGSGYMKTKFIILQNSDAIIPITIGSGGVGQSGAAGTSGGATSFGSYLTAEGGGGGGVVNSSPNYSSGGSGGFPGGNGYYNTSEKKRRRRRRSRRISNWSLAIRRSRSKSC